MATSRALTSTYSLMKLLSPMNLSPTLVRNLRVPVVIKRIDSELKNNPVPCAKDYPSPNGDWKEAPMVTEDDVEALYVKYAMLGIGREEELKLQVDNNFLHVRAEGKVGPSNFRYYNSINLPSSSFKVEEIEADIKAGILEIKVPKIKSEDTKMGTIRV